MTEAKPTTFIEIPGAPGYDAGDDGHIYSRRGHFFTGDFNPRKQLKEKIDRYGYRVVQVILNGCRTQVGVHRLVLMAFHGPCPPGMMSCHFPDRDRTKNMPSNLMWGTNQTNQLHRRDHGTAVAGASNPKAKFSDETVIAIRQEYESSGITQVELARRHEVHRSTIARILQGRTWVTDGKIKNFSSRSGRRSSHGKRRPKKSS